jgi:hypothetical protein
MGHIEFHFVAAKKLYVLLLKRFRTMVFQLVSNVLRDCGQLSKLTVNAPKPFCHSNEHRCRGFAALSVAFHSAGLHPQLGAVAASPLRLYGSAALRLQPS